MGSRDPGAEHVVAWVDSVGERAAAATYADAASSCELACLVTAWSGTENAIRLCVPDNLAGKVVVDVTNPLVFGPEGPGLALGTTDSAGEQVQRWLPRSHVVKAWNIVGNANMVDPQVPGGPPDMFFCGDDAGAKQTVADLLRECGWPSIDAGGIRAARQLESLALLWISYAITHQRSDHAFKLLRSSD